MSKEKTKRVSPEISQGIYPALGTISHTDPQTQVGTAPGPVRSIIKTGSSEPETHGSTRFKHDTTTVTTPAGHQPPPPGMPAITRRAKYESPIKRLRRKEGR